MSRQRMAAIALFGLLCAAAPALAHHSFTAEFDPDKMVGVKGILTRVEWENPHIWFYVDVKDDKGAVANWAFETVSPNPISHQYPTARRDFTTNIGKEIVIAARPAKIVPHRGSAQVIKMASGKIMKVGLAPAPDEDEILERAAKGN